MALVEAQHAELTAIRSEVQTLRALPAVAAPKGSTAAGQDADIPSPERCSKPSQRCGKRSGLSAERYQMLAHALVRTWEEVPRRKAWWRRLLGL